MVGQTAQVVVGILGMVLLLLVRYRLLAWWWGDKDGGAKFDASGLVGAYPRLKGVLRIYQVAELGVPFLSLVGVAGLVYGLGQLYGNRTLQTLQGFFLLYGFFGLLEVFRGVFNVIWRVEVVYGFMTRPGWRKYMFDERVRSLGYVRLGVMGIMTLVWVVLILLIS